MVSYLISMGIRLVCIALCFVVPGWWILIPAGGAIILPLIAVALANVKNQESTSPTQTVSTMHQLERDADK
jgi:hypothetical protein